MYLLTLTYTVFLGEGYILTRVALERLVPLFECLPHYQPEDTWITGFLCDYQNISRHWLPGTYFFFNDGGLSYGRTVDYNRPTLEKLLTAFNDHTNTVQSMKFNVQNPQNHSLQFVASNDWFEQQIVSRSLHVNSVHLKLSAQELRCLWKRGITSEQLYIDYLLHSTWKSSKTFHKLLLSHAERILPRIPVSKNERISRARFRCLN